MGKGYDIYSPESIEEYGKLLENRTFKEILTERDTLIKESEYAYQTSKEAKGSLGQLIEKYHFDYEPNSNPKPDFEEANVELKVTPFKRLKNGKVSAKERLVLNIINYEELVNERFEKSTFWLKNQLLLLIHYLYEKDKDKLDYLIKKVHLYRFRDKDLEVIKNDWEFIRNKVIKGKAHEISEGDTSYLGACTKGATKNSLRSQPYSDEKAMQRAFALKTSFMTTLLRQIMSEEAYEEITNTGELAQKSIQEILNDRFKPYFGMTPAQIAEKVNIRFKPSTKNIIPQIISAILGIKGVKLDQIEEFAKANIEFKTVRLEPNGIPKEHMSFENIRFNEVVKESWQDSFIRNRFLDKKFLFVIFQYDESESKNNNREPYFKGIKLWNMPESILDDKIYELWKAIQDKVRRGVRLTHHKWGSGYRTSNDLPGADFNGVGHVRPKAQNSNDKVLLPDGQHITKQSYWLNREYISHIIENE
uniref:Sau3AI family type II restriction endonuclease n=1 Tax=uncultured Allobacillus sp. TaxID=1638025 RepID=UPI00259907D2|nr:Sau3AI family type II restriction endonuclease [uncultured Allobacillus sp.]